MTFHEQVEAAVRSVSPKGHVVVETRGGDHAILWGTLDSQTSIERVEQAAWSVPGVCNVESHLTVLARPAADSVS